MVISGDRLIELKKEKEKIQLEIQKVKIQNKSMQINNKSPNQLIRVGYAFNKKIEEIIKRRMEKGIDVFPISKPKITDLFIKHKTISPKLIEEIVNFRFEGGKNKK